MRRPRKASGVVVACVLCAAMVGCFPGAGATHTAFIRGVRGLATPSADCLHAQTTLIEQPAGDAYLTRGLWESAGKPLPHELATLLAMNGVRVGVFTGHPPGEFDRLVSSDHSTVNPTFRTMQPGKPKIVPVNGPIERIDYRVLAELTADPTRTTATGAECGLSLTAWPADNSRVRLVCELQVQHGDRQSWLAPTADGAAFAREDRKSLESFPTLNWEVTLSPGDYLVVGATNDPAGTLGQAFFFPTVNGVLRQRVVVVKAAHGLTTEARPLAVSSAK